jgi:DNA-binding NarL/FixJ family response regulator
MATIRLLIADDHEVVRCGLRKILETQPTMEIVSEAGDGEDAVSKAIAEIPDVAVIDYSMPKLNGAQVTRRIRKRLPNTEVLIFTSYESEALIAKALRAGARGYLLKSDASEHLIAAVEALAAHKPFFSANVSNALLRAVTAGPRRQASRTGTPHHSRELVKPR